MNADSEVLEKALNNKELVSYLSGSNGYSFVDQYSDIPTDTIRVFNSISNYYLTQNDVSIWHTFQCALLEMCKKPDNVWLVPYYITSYSFFHEHQKKDYIDLLSIVNATKSSITTHSKQLSLNHNWVGKQYKNGLMGEVERVSKNIKERFAIELI